mgnify:CR=1 FL=1
MNEISISYCIACWNEHEELARLLPRLIQNLGKEDEIIIQGDEGKVTDEVMDVIREYCSYIQYFEFPLNKDFASFKNSLISEATKDYIFLLDPDEIPHPRMLQNLKWLLFENREIDVFRIPRVNIVQNITEQYVREQRWNLVRVQVPKSDYDSKNILEMYGIQDEFIEVVNPFDPQSRIFKNNGIKYHSDIKVHEQLINFKMRAEFPTKKELFDELDFDWSLFHIKQFEKQQRQNKFYETI